MGGLFATISALTNLAAQRLLFTSLTSTCRVVIDQTLNGKLWTIYLILMGNQTSLRHLYSILYSVFG